MPRRRPEAASLYDFRDLELMWKIVDEQQNGSRGVSSIDLADALGFDEGVNRPIGMRLAWMRKYGMVLYDEREKLWSLSAGGARVLDAHERSHEIEVVDKLPDESMIDVMAHVTSRYRHGKSMIAQMLRREFLYGTQKR